MYLSSLLPHLTCHVLEQAKPDRHGRSRPLKHSIQALFSMEMNWVVQCDICGQKVTGSTQETLLRLPVPRKMKNLEESEEVWNVAEELSSLRKK